MDTNDSTLIMTLKAVSATAERSWTRPQNRDRCLPASESHDEEVAISSREATPAIARPGSQIRLTFDDKPKDLEKGFIFGSDLGVCDIFLGERDAGFSRRHFRIAFNERGEVIFENTSRKKALVNYNGSSLPGRNQFSWILFDTYTNITIAVGDEDGLSFKVEWPEHRDLNKVKYKAHRDAYFEERQKALPPLSQLGVESQQTTAQHSPKQQPLYLAGKVLGCGSFGTVYKVVDVTTGYEYAAKLFHSGNWKREVEILRKISHVSVIIGLHNQAISDLSQRSILCNS